MGNSCCKENTFETDIPIYRRKIYFTLTKEGFYEHRTKHEIRVRKY